MSFLDHMAGELRARRQELNLDLSHRALLICDMAFCAVVHPGLSRLLLFLYIYIYKQLRFGQGFELGDALAVF